MFYDRLEAGHLLAKKLDKYKNSKSILLAVPRGGVPVTYAIAQDLNLPVDLILTKKIGHPFNKEYAIGAASMNDYIISAKGEEVDNKYIQEEVVRVQNRLREMNRLFHAPSKPTSLKGKTVIIVDDGIATGSTLLHSIQLIKKEKPSKIIIAVPVASNSSQDKLRGEVDELIVLESHEFFRGVGAYYELFDQVSDEEVIKFLNSLTYITH